MQPNGISILQKEKLNIKLSKSILKVIMASIVVIAVNTSCTKEEIRKNNDRESDNVAICGFGELEEEDYPTCGFGEE